MVREVAINLYLFIFRIVFSIAKLFHQKKKTTLVTSFGDNVWYTVKALEKETEEPIIILKTAQCQVDFRENNQRTVLQFEWNQPLNWIQSVYHLATSRMVFIDNYFGFLAATPFKQNVNCVQLWHAVGAIKQFGLKDPAIKGRSKRAIVRFQKVYQRFDYVVVGSEHMATIFQESFGLPDECILRTGIPRTDFYFDQLSMDEAAQQMIRSFPIIAGKKIMLYAPTFRDDSLDSSEVALDIEKLYHEFGSDYVLLLRLHPAIQGTFQNQYPDFIVDVSSYPSIHHIFVVTDLLITDYSSIPFEFSLLDKPMIFFAYDFEQYAETRGFTEKYNTLVPGPIVKNTESLIKSMNENSFDYKLIRSFAKKWNEYSFGDSSDCLIRRFYQQ